MIEFPTTNWKDYELLDSGDGEKLERFGSFVLARPEPKALWNRSLPMSEWNRLAHTRFKPGAGFSKAGKEDSGTWERLRQMDDQWWIRYNSLCLRLGLTSFKHVGVFPEQAPNWDFIYRKCSGMDHPKVLNLFAYTGAASLAALAGGAEVTHLDSVKQVVTWARQNMERTFSPAGGAGGVCRWVVEDAMKFARREARRGNLYDGIILDPPAYGHGPDGEKWKLDECLFDMLRTVASILKPHNSFVVLNLYSNGYSAALGETLVREAFGIRGAGKSEAERSECSDRGRADDNSSSPDAILTSGELALRDNFGKVLPLSIVVRLETPSR